MSTKVKIGEKLYPERLLSLEDAPKTLYVEGNLPGEQETIAVIGARICSEYGRYVARQTGEHLARAGFSLISGLSYGIDSTAAKAALQAGGAVYGIMPCGVDICYPPEMLEFYWNVRNQYGVLSEFADGKKPKQEMFQDRSRLIAAMADAVIVVEARAKSATFETARIARSLGKPVFAFPGRVTDRLSDGCIRMIRENEAKIACSAEDMVEALHAMQKAG